jgi:hypothetical protein
MGAEKLSKSLTIEDTKYKNNKTYNSSKITKTILT